MVTDIEQEHNDNNASHQAGYYPGSDWSLPYISGWSRIHADPELVSVLRHMNCSYLGQPGTPPTLLGLKQHARSLAKLIMLLEPSVNSGVQVDGARFDDVDNVNDAQRRLGYAGAFDWLSDLGAPYTNDDPHHHRPLNALANEVKGRHDIGGTIFHCPLTDSPKRPFQGAEGTRSEHYVADVNTKPFASHYNLAMHANACLEHLDHEFSATGGLLSLIPPDDKAVEAGKPSVDVVALKNSLLGQFLMFCQGLCVRTQELSIEHANLLDVMAAEAVAPAQELSRLGPDARKGRVMAYPQDRWILANSGDDIFNKLHSEFDRQEKLYEQKMLEYKKAGISGTTDWELHRGGKEYARGIIPIHVMTRYYRLAGKGRSTIFVIPAAEIHPGLEATRNNVEKKPGIASLIQPRWPERISAWERKYQQQILDAANHERDAWRLRREKTDSEKQLHGMQLEVERQTRIAEAATEMMTAVRLQGGDDENAEAQRAELERQMRDQQANWESRALRRRERKQARDSERYLQALQWAKRLAVEANPQSEMATYLRQVLHGADGAAGDDDDMDML